MNVGVRLEWLFARLSLQIAHSLGGKAKWDDFIRFHGAIDEDEQQDQATMADLVSIVGVRKTVKNDGRKK